MERISEGFDEFGNPVGHAFDLGGGDEDRVRGERILFYACSIPDGNFAESELRALMAERGLELDVRHAPQGGACDLSEGLLSGYTQLWYVSGSGRTLSGQQVQMVTDYVRDGNGLAIWADNEPFYADANALAQALIGSCFSGNKMADRVMVPGPERTPGRFIEHQLTHGVNNLYEGITICTIQPTPDVTILGQSHDGQLCLGCFEREDERIVLDTGFTKLYREKFHMSAGLGRYLSNIAFWLAQGSRGVDYQLLTPGREQIASIGKGETSRGYQFTVARPATVTGILHWDGRATLGLTMRAPDGTVGRQGVSSTSPLRVSLPAGIPGIWIAQVEGIDVPARAPYVLTLSHETAPQGGGTTEGIVMPFYLICDTSAATADGVSDLNAALRQIQRKLARRMNDIVMLSVITFNDSARAVVPLAAPSTITLPTLSAGGGRSFSLALSEYHRAFEQDRQRLKARGARVVRPCVFFLTQGDPDDADHVGTFHSLLGYDPAAQHGNRAYPTVVPIGLPGASRHAVATLAYPDFGDPNRRGRWFLAEPGTSSAAAWRSVVDVVCQTVKESHATAAQGAPMFAPPAPVPGTIGGIAGLDV